MSRTAEAISLHNDIPAVKVFAAYFWLTTAPAKHSRIHKTIGEEGKASRMYLL